MTEKLATKTASEPHLLHCSKLPIVQGLQQHIHEEGTEAHGQPNQHCSKTPLQSVMQESSFQSCTCPMSRHVT